VKGYQVYGRNEPCNIVRILEALSGILEIPEQEIASKIYRQTIDFFSLDLEGKRKNNFV
jgi:Tat protein secretion system quality control protein TatD with DNase activity